MTIGYGTQPLDYNFTPAIHNTDLVGKVLLFKQDKFNKAYEKVQDLRKTALSIQFLNEGKQKEIDQFNTDLNEFFVGLNGEYGDLSKESIVQQYAKRFNSLASNTNLINAYHKDVGIQKQARKVEEMKNSKDPLKAGFHPINYSNWMRELNNYKSADLDKDDFQITPYTNFTDTDGEMAKIIKQIDTHKWSETISNPDGSMTHYTYNGRPKGSVTGALKPYLTGRGMAQLREEAKYDFYNNKDNPDYFNDLYQESQSSLIEQKDMVGKQIEKLKSIISTKGADSPEGIKALETQSSLEDSLSKIKENIMTVDEFSKLDENGLINVATSTLLNQTLDSMENAFGQISTSKVTKVDPHWAKIQDLKLKYGELQRRARADGVKALKDSKGNVSFQGATANDPLGKDIPGAITSTRTSQVNLFESVESVEQAWKDSYLSTTNLLKTGLKGKMLPSAIQMDQNLERLKQEKLDLQREMGIKTARNITYDPSTNLSKIKELNTQIDKLSNERELNLTPIQLARKIITSPEELTMSKSLKGNAYLNALEYLRATKDLDSNSLSDTDIEMYINEAKELVMKEGGIFNKMDKQNKTQHGFLNNYLKGNENFFQDKEDYDFNEEERKALQLYLDNTDVMGVVGGVYLDLQQVSAKAGEAGREVLARPFAARKLAESTISRQVTYDKTIGSHNLTGYKFIDGKSIEDKDWHSIETFPNGDVEILLNDNFFDRIEVKNENDELMKGAYINARNKNGIIEPIKIERGKPFRFYNEKGDVQNIGMFTPVTISHKEYSSFFFNEGQNSFDIKKLSLNGGDAYLLREKGKEPIMITDRNGHPIGSDKINSFIENYKTLKK